MSLTRMAVRGSGQQPAAFCKRNSITRVGKADAGLLHQFVAGVARRQASSHAPLPQAPNDGRVNPVPMRRTISSARAAQPAHARASSLASRPAPNASAIRSVMVVPIWPAAAARLVLQIVRREQQIEIAAEETYRRDPGVQRLASRDRPHDDSAPIRWRGMNSDDHATTAIGVSHATAHGVGREQHAAGLRGARRGRTA